MRAPFRMDEALYGEESEGIGTAGYLGLLIGTLGLAGYYVYRKKWKRNKRE
jgi:hypothetical protein